MDPQTVPGIGHAGQARLWSYPYCQFESQAKNRYVVPLQALNIFSSTATTEGRGSQRSGRWKPWSWRGSRAM